jgi:hypothetical protein
VLSTAGKLQVVGPVILKVGGTKSATVNGTVGDAANPDWLSLLIPKAGLTVAANSSVSGFVVARLGAVNLTGRLDGGVSCDRVIIGVAGSLHDGR